MTKTTTQDAAIDRRHALGRILAASAFLAVPRLAKANGADNVLPTISPLSNEYEEAWAAERAVLAAYLQDDALEDAHSAAADRTRAIVRRIIAEPARDIEGLKLKGRAYLWCYADDREEALGVLLDQAETTDAKVIHALMRDLLALGGEA